MDNPFSLGVVPPEGPFCDREKELEALTRHARNGDNVVVHSPRRFGKTSLVKRVQHRLHGDSFLTVYVDLFGVTSVDDIATWTAKRVYRELQRRESLFDKAGRMLAALPSFRPVLRPSETGETVSLTVEPAARNLSGLDLLDRTLEDLGRFIEKHGPKIHVVFDEFQEITELKNPRVEGVMRSHIQNHPASYFFVGSRRRLLLNMFGERTRPFYRSAFLMELPPLPRDYLARFIGLRFKAAGKQCPAPVAETIAAKVAYHPYYAQKTASKVFELTESTAHEDLVIQAFEAVLDEESPFFEAILQGLTVKQIAFLRALAADPGSAVFGRAFLNEHSFSVSTVQRILPQMIRLDLVEQARDKTCRLVDPVFSEWLRRREE